MAVYYATVRQVVYVTLKIDSDWGVPSEEDILDLMCDPDCRLDEVEVLAELVSLEGDELYIDYGHKKEND